jgi:hypothetical protein
VVRRKASRGELPVSLQERIEILVILAAGGEEEDQSAALNTLQSWPPKELQQVLQDPATPLSVLSFSATNLSPHRKELGDVLLGNPSLPGELRVWLESALALIAEAESSESSEGSAPLPPAREGPNPRREERDRKRLTAIQRTQGMSVLQKVKAALTGSQEERMILVRDSNKLVARAVMQSPKLSEHEVENYASMKDISEEALRVITLNRKFMRLYSIVRALANNPRTPIDVGLHLLSRVYDADLKRLALNRNVSDVIRHAAEKLIRQKEEAARMRSQGKF